MFTSSNSAHHLAPSTRALMSDRKLRESMALVLYEAKSCLAADGHLTAVVEKMALWSPRTSISLTFINERQVTSEHTTIQLRMWPPVWVGKSTICVRSWTCNSLELLDFTVGGAVIMKIEVIKDHKIIARARIHGQKVMEFIKKHAVSEFVFPVWGRPVETHNWDKLSPKWYDWIKWKRFERCAFGKAIFLFCLFFHSKSNSTTSRCYARKLSEL